eukprot:100145_1
MTTRLFEIKKLTETKQKIKDIVFGYMKQQYKMMENINSVKLIDYLVLAYYFIQFDIWDQKHISNNLILKKNTLTLSHSSLKFPTRCLDCSNSNIVMDHHTYRHVCTGCGLILYNQYVGTSSFLTEVITSGTFTWKFRMLDLDDTYPITIGIWRINNIIQTKTTLDQNCFEDYNKYCYGYSFQCETYMPWGRGIPINGEDDLTARCRNNDVITMTLDMNNLHLEFKVNGVVKGGWYNIDVGQYTGVVSILKPNNSISLTK